MYMYLATHGEKKLRVLMIWQRQELQNAFILSATAKNCLSGEKQLSKYWSGYGAMAA